MTFYEQCLAKGCTPKMAEMLASRQAPLAANSDQAFMRRNLNHGLDDLPKQMQDEYIRRAKKAGIDIAGKVYVPQVADIRGGGDPRAWVADTHDLLSVARDRNLEMNGVVNHKALEEAPAEDVPLAEKLVKSNIADALRENPELALKPVQELREMVIEKHGAPANKKASALKPKGYAKPHR